MELFFEIDLLIDMKQKSFDMPIVLNIDQSVRIRSSKVIHERTQSFH
jgi:hypothetical protein